MRVLQVVTDTDRRGAQVFAVDLHGALERRGLDMATVALAPGGTGGLELMELGPSRRSLRTLTTLRRLAARADVVVAHGSTTLPVCALVCPTVDTPFVYRQISESLFWAPSRSRRARVRLALGRAARVVALWEGSARVLTDVFGVDRRRVSIIPNGVVSERFPRVAPSERERAREALGLDDDRPVVATVGALAPEKGVDLVLRAAATSAPGSLQVIVAGDGPARASLEDLARSLGVDATFTGSLPDPRPAFAAADAVVLASRGGDSMPAVLIEAGLLALPVVATPVEAITEIVEDGISGRLAPPEPKELASAIRDVLASTEVAQRMGEAGRARCLRRYDLEVVADRWHEVLAETGGR